MRGFGKGGRRRKAAPPGAETEVVVSALGGKGDGIADSAVGRLYIPFAAPGDRLIVRPLDTRGDAKGDSFAAEIVKILQCGEDRADPVCSHFGECGGCALQHLEAGPYLSWKRRQVVAALERRGLPGAVVEPTVPTRPGDRRRADLMARRTGRGVIVGFHRRLSHRLVDISECPVLDPALVALLPQLRDLLGEILPVGGTASLPMTVTDSGIVLLIEADLDATLAQRETLGRFAESHDLAAVALRRPGGTVEPVVERRRPELRFGDVAVSVPPGAFLQAGRQSQAALVAAVCDGVGEAVRVADLFAGCGTFALPLSRRARVHAVEGDPALAAALQDAVNATAGQRAVTVEQRDLYRRPLAPGELASFDAVVFDPPRAGAREQAVALAASQVPVAVGVSCNPATFARDARLLVDGGYVLERVVPIDQFLWSHHVELAALFRRD